MNKSKMSLQDLTKTATVYVNFVEEKCLSTLASLNVCTHLSMHMLRLENVELGSKVSLWYCDLFVFRHLGYLFIVEVDPMHILRMENVELGNKVSLWYCDLIVFGYLGYLFIGEVDLSTAH